MKNYYLLSVLLGFGCALHAQQDAQFSQNMYNRLSVNPAYAGSNDATCITLLGRNQWVGFEGAPKTGLISVEGPVIAAHGGFGVTIGYDQLGFEKSLGARIAYAYRTDLGPGKLGLGIDAGILQKSINGNWVATDPVANDKSIPAAVSATAPDFTFGAYYNTTDLYFGLSASHLAEGDLKYGSINYKMARHYYIIGGYKKDITSSLAIMPSAWIKSDASATIFDINCNLLYDNRFWGGLSYRFTDAIVAMVGANSGNFKFGYSYDITTSAIRGYSSGTHEIMLGYCFKTTSAKPLPRNMNVRFL